MHTEGHGRERRLVLLSCLLWGCDAPLPYEAQQFEQELADAVPMDETGHWALRFARNRSYRRESLIASLVDPTLGYAQRRLKNYALEDESGIATKWDGLPLELPLVARVMQGQRTTPAQFQPIWTTHVPWRETDLLALGQRAFHEWPLQVASNARRSLREQGSLETLGLPQTQGQITGVIWNRTKGGGPQIYWTCAACHTRRLEDGSLMDGPANERLDVGALAAHSWGQGRMDVTPDGMDNPTAPPNLLGLRFQTHLHWSGAMHNNLTSLAIRIETLMIEASSARLRPPRQVAFALALYLRSLGDLPQSPTVPAEPRGQILFEQHCARCHASNGTVSGPLPSQQVGTHTSVALSPTRGTENYRVPSLWGVRYSGQFLHNASVKTLDHLLSPRSGNQAGHAYGVYLSPDDKAALIRFVRNIGVSP